MKKLLLFLLFINGFCQAQVVIPDFMFHSLLVNQPPGFEAYGHDYLPIVIDANQDGEIQFSEAESVASLTIPPESGVQDLTGIGSFTYLKSLVCPNNYLTSLDLSNLGYLEYLDVQNNQLTSVNFTGANSIAVVYLQYNQLPSLSFDGYPMLTEIECDNNPMVSINLTNLPQLASLRAFYCDLNTINLSNLPSLHSLYCAQNNLTELDVSGFAALQNLDCGLNQLTAINTTGCTQISSLNCGGNMLTTLDLTGLSLLHNLGCADNLLTNLDLSPVAVLNSLGCNGNLFTTLDFSGVPQLYSLSVGNPELISLDVSMLSSNLHSLGIYDVTLSNVDMSNLTELTNVHFANSEVTSIDLSHNQAAELDLEANFNPYLEYINMKNGQPDTNLSVWQCPELRFVCINEEVPSSICLSCLPPTVQANSYCAFSPGGNYNTITGTLRLDADQNGCDTNDIAMPFAKVEMINGANTGYSFLDNSSVYNFYTDAGSYLITPIFENPEYFNVTPPTATINFAEANSTVTTQNFCITPNGIHPDAEISIVPVGGARPGFNANYQIVYTNKGNQILNGAITLTFDDARTDLVSASPTANNQSFNTLVWNYTDLFPFETRMIEFVLNLNGPMETPPLNQNDILGFSAVMSYAIPDVAAYSTDCSLQQVVVNSLDPNDKTCLEGNIISPEMIGDYVHYNINFENIGTAEAINIVVKDVIDTTKFDISTLQVIYASHPVMTRINGNVVEFIFENINLPGTLDNHGNVMFKIKTKATLVVGNSISNKADIFFDYNFPIETNTATSTFNVLKNQQFNVDVTISVYPNPAKDKIFIKADSAIKSLQLYDLQGRILQSSIENSTETSIDISAKSNGIYFLCVTTDQGSKIEKLIKE